MTFDFFTRTHGLSALALLSGLIVSTTAFAAEFRWTGSASDNLWDTVGNWEVSDGNRWDAATVLPGADDSVRLDDTPSNSAQTIDMGPLMVSVHSLVLEATGERNYTVTGTGELELTDDLGSSIRVNASSTTNLILDVETRNDGSIVKIANLSPVSRLVLGKRLSLGGMSMFGQEGDGMTEVRAPIEAGDNSKNNARWNIPAQRKILFNYGGGLVFNRNIRLVSGDMATPANLYFSQDTKLSGIWAWPGSSSGMEESTNFQLLEAGSNDVVVSVSSITSMAGVGDSLTVTDPVLVNLAGPADSSSGSLTLQVNGGIGPGGADGSEKRGVSIVIGSGNFVKLGGTISAPVASNLAGGLTGEGGLVKASAGTSEIGEVNTYTGGTFIEEGNLKLIETLIPDMIGSDPSVNYAGTLGIGPLHIASGSKFEMNDLNQTVAGLRDSEETNDGGEVNLGPNSAGTLIMDVASDSSFSGNISGSGAVRKVGDAFQILSGTVGFSGDLNVAGGVLSAEGAITDTVALSVETGGALLGTGTIAANTIIEGTLAPGNPIGKLSFTGDLAFAPNANVYFEFGETENDLIVLNGSSQSLTASGPVQWFFGGGGHITTGTDYKLIDWSASTTPSDAEFPIPAMQIRTAGWVGTFSSVANDGLYVNFTKIP